MCKEFLVAQGGGTDDACGEDALMGKGPRDGLSHGGWKSLRVSGFPISGRGSVELVWDPRRGPRTTPGPFGGSWGLAGRKTFTASGWAGGMFAEQ